MAMTQRRYIYNYYTVYVPFEIGSVELRSDLAIEAAREQARLWCMPCEWQVMSISEDSDLVRVRRKRNRK